MLQQRLEFAFYSK